VLDKIIISSIGGLDAKDLALLINIEVQLLEVYDPFKPIFRLVHRQTNERQKISEGVSH